MTTTRRQALRTGLITAAASPVVAGASGCATLLDLLDDFIKPPDLSLKSFAVTGWTLSSVSVHLVAVLKNPNPFGFRIDGLDWGVKLAGGAVAKGAARKGFTLKPRGTSETPLDLEFDLAKTAAAVLELLAKKSVPLGLNAVAHLRAQRYKFDIPAEFETRLPLPQLPVFDVPRFEFKGLSGAGLRFAVEPLVRNPNGFDVDIDAFDFDVKLGGRQVVRSKQLKNVKIVANDKKRVPFDFDVDLVDLGLTVATLASKPRLDWELGANLKSGLFQLPFKQGGRLSL
ncbi:MAG: LEA type 2 family protein [Deltaproteobacteria bacterium]|nr:LEA type 2 family protein [Deltaproteobacteria bacterium]